MKTILCGTLRRPAELRNTALEPFASMVQTKFASQWVRDSHSWHVRPRAASPCRRLSFLSVRVFALRTCIRATFGLTELKTRITAHLPIGVQADEKLTNQKLQNLRERERKKKNRTSFWVVRFVTGKSLDSPEKANVEKMSEKCPTRG